MARFYGTATSHRSVTIRATCLRLFNLVFDSGEPPRMCRVMWRHTRQVGVRFE
jgi:hypothetical protein